MAVTKISRSLILIVFALGSRAFAMGKGKVKLIFNFLTQDGNGGDQIYGNTKKEEVTVVEPMLFVDYQIDKETNVKAHFVFDAWTAASDTELDGNTGASGAGIKNQTRTAGNFGYSKDHSTYAWSGNLGFSTEYDYRSLNFSGSWEGRYLEDNFTIGFRPQLYLDQAKFFDLQNAITTGYKSRVIAAAELTASQVLTPSDILQFGYSYIHANGKLENISNTVKVNTNPYGNAFSRMEEIVPDKRRRQAISTNLVHGFSDEAAASFNYRYYKDSWDIKAHTIQLDTRLTFAEDDIFLMPSYRYHQQDAVGFYKSEFAAQEEHMTSDSDLSSFTAHRLGLHFSNILGDKKAYNIDFYDVSFSSAIYHYKRSNDLNYTILQIGINSEF